MKALKKATTVIFALLIFLVLSLRVNAGLTDMSVRLDDGGEIISLEDGIESITISTMPSRTEYLSLSRFEPEGLSLTVTYDDGVTEVIGEEELSVTYPRGDLLYYGDNSVTVSYRGHSVSVPVSVKRRDYDLSGIIVNSRVVTYNGDFHAITPSGDMPKGLDGIELKYTVLFPKCDAGTYRQTVIFSTESEEYNTPAPIYATLHILPQELELIWSDEPLVYDGTQKAPTAEAKDASGSPVEITVYGGKVGAGDGYVATAICTSDNFTVKNPYKAFSIEKADYDMSGARWVIQDFIYDGSEKRVYVDGLPIGVGVARYTDAAAHEGGEYSATAILSYDTVNYNEPVMPVCKWRILPASYDMSGARFSDSEFIYDGEMHFPRLVGALPIGLDGSTPKYSFSTGATHVSDGRVAVEIIFESESRNYLAPPSMSATVLILPKSISVTWGGSDFVYDGSLKAPVAVSDECELSVSGAATSAGEYIAYAAPLTEDFIIKNPECAFRIAKAENGVIGSIEIPDIYASGTPVPSVKLIHGVAHFRYFADEECKIELSLPLPVGRVYLKAYAEESENYLAYESSAVSFTVMPLLPVGISVEGLTGKYSAYQRVSEEGGRLFLCFNDGSRKHVPFSGASIRYENGDSFRYGDKYFFVSYGGFECEVAVTVTRAEYDLSAVTWSESTFVFDGEVKSVYLSGLPAGVSVLYYENNEGIRAGEYEVTAYLAYDRENYNPPENPTCRLVIKKCPLPVPEGITSEFSGAYQPSPIPNSSLYSIESPLAKNAGVYKLTLTLSDPENYEWEGLLGAVCYVDFEVLPCEILIELPSISVYLFEGLPKDESIFEKSPIDGSLIPITLRAERDKIVGISADSNYRIKILGGEVVHRFIPSPGALRIIALVLLIILLLILLVFLTKKYGKRVLYRIKVRKRAPIVLGAREEEKKESIPTPVSEKLTENEGNDEENIRGNGEIEKTILGMDESRADELISDSLAKNLLRRNDAVVETYGRRKSVINVDTLSSNFSSGDKVDVNLLKGKSLIPYDTGYIKVLARGVIDKPLRIYANDFSLSAVKMIALTGGEAIKCVTQKSTRGKENT